MLYTVNILINDISKVQQLSLSFPIRASSLCGYKTARYHLLPSTHPPLFSTVIVCLSQTASLCFQDISDVYLIMCLKGPPPFPPTVHLLCRVTMMGITYIQQDHIAAFLSGLCDLVGNVTLFLIFFKYSHLCM